MTAVWSDGDPEVPASRCRMARSLWRRLKTGEPPFVMFRRALAPPGMRPELVAGPCHLSRRCVSSRHCPCPVHWT